MIFVKNEGFLTFEQDIRELLNAFFPGEKISGERSGEAFFFVDIDELMKNTELSGNRAEDKSLVKKRLYSDLSEKTGKTLPWGTLTGIKPVKLAEKIRCERKSAEETVRAIEERYLVSHEKAELMVALADKENILLEGLPLETGYSVYLGIPFCPTRCLYCSFTSNPLTLWKERTGEYLDCLRREMEGLRDLQRRRKGSSQLTPSTVYIGGGTPSALSAEEMDRLLDMTEEFFDSGNIREFTVEAGRPDSITREKLRVLRKHGISRISVNPQTMNQKTLDLIGRRHTSEETVKAFYTAREEGFDNINMDLIMGLPGETLPDVENTLQKVEELHPESLTVHSLSVKRAARLSTEHDPWLSFPRALGEEAAQMIRLGAESARRMGMEPYYLYRQKNMAGNQENIGYTVPGKESLYNIIMMEEKQAVIGFGAGSTSKLGSGTADRMENVKDLTRYFSRIGELVEKRNIFFENTRLFS